MSFKILVFVLRVSHVLKVRGIGFLSWLLALDSCHDCSLKNLFIYLTALGLSCGVWDLVTWPGVKPGPPALGVCRILAIGPPGKSFDSSSAGRYTHPMDRRRSVFIPITKNGNAKDCSNYHTIALISHASKVKLKIFQARLQQKMNWELPDVQAGFRKGWGTRDQITNIHWIVEKQKNSRRTSTSASLTILKPLTV